MTTPNQLTEAEQAIKDVVYWNKILGDAKKYQAIEDVLKAEPELEKAIEELSSFGKDEVVTQDMIDVCKSLDIVLNAAKRLKEVEKERDCWIYNANELQKGYNKIDKELSQLRTEYKQALKALNR